MTLLRLDLLAGRAVAADGVARDGAVCGLLAELGAQIEVLPGGDLEEWAAHLPPLDALVCSCSAPFQSGGEVGLQAALERAWAAVRAVATGALIDRGRGKIVLIAPQVGEGEHGAVAAAALENLARTLSVEWARHGVTACVVVPGPAAGDDELAELICFLVSPAGEYFSGCRFDLGKSPA